jgi:nicotinate-nucleotide adenylyltransferase
MGVRTSRLLLACAALVALAGVARAGRPFPEIDAILARQPKARIAIVQGSFDWVHKGHVELFGAARKAYDYVVVVPTREYARKPYLRSSFDRRVRLIEQAIAAEPELRGRVAVSRATATIPNRPSEILTELTRRYPGRGFAYVLGADSFDESKDWPGFPAFEKHPDISLVAVARGGARLEHPERAAAVLDGPTTRISSSEIRRALAAGDVKALKDRVPRTTYLALSLEAARRRRERPAGAALVGGPTSSERSFAEVRAEIPPGVTDLLTGVEETKLPEDVRVRLVTVQERLNAARRDFDATSKHVSARSIDPVKGYSEKLILLARQAGRIRGQYAFKSLTETDARKVESLSMLANLVGVPTAPAIPYTVREGRVGQTGVVTPWIGGLEQAKAYDFKRASPRVRESLLVSRWFSEVVGNQDVWWGQFLHPGGGPGRWDEMVHLDHKAAWIARDPQAVQAVLKQHWGIERPLSDTSWTDKRYRFDEPVGWAPRHYDSMFTMYGGLWRDYVLGRVDIDVGAVKARLATVKQIPREVLARSLAPYLSAASAEHWGKIPLRAANRFVAPKEFEKKLLDRIYRSVDEYGVFLDRMRAARANPEDEIHRFYAAQGERGF